MSKKKDPKSPVTKMKFSKLQKRTKKIEKEVLKFTKTNSQIDLDLLDDTVDNID